jgi:choline-sulfatase
VVRPRLRTRLPAAAAAVALALAAAGCGKERPAAKSRRGTPVVLVSIDTLRSDHLPMYGYSGVVTPVLSAFAKEAVLFEKAYSHVPLTLPSHGTIFTGTLPAVNGLRDNRGYSLDPKIPTVAELLKRAGYDTGGAVSSIVLNAGCGIARGFDYWEDSVEPNRPGLAVERAERSGAVTEALLAGWVEKRPLERPFFAFLHLYEPHFPYSPPEPYASRYRNHEYDGEIAWSDELVGRFLGLLKARGLYDRSLVIILSDHGEGLGEHGEDEHGIFLYRYALQVPLMIKLPGSQKGGTRVATPVQLSDVFTTILRGAGLDGVPAPAGTVSLLDVVGGENPSRNLYSETLFPRIHMGWSDLASLIDGPWQYIEAPRPELYDLEKDPAENENLAAGKPPAFRSLRMEMEKRRAAFTAPSEVNAEEAKKLASLGYLSRGVSAGTGPLPDPKDGIHLMSDLKRAVRLMVEHRYDEAVGAFQKLLGQNPRMWEVSDIYSQALVWIGRDEEALDVLKRGVRASPEGATHYFLSIAELCLKLGKLDEALANAQLARRRGDPGAEEMLARIYLAEGKPDAAEAEARAALSARPNDRQLRLILARVRLEKNDLAGALALVDEIRGPGDGRDSPPLRNLHFLRGEILRRQRRLIEAEAEYREEARAWPENLEAWSALATLCVSQGRPPEAHDAIQKMLDSNPAPATYLRAMKTLEAAGDRPGAEWVRREAVSKFPSDRRFSRKG